MVLVTIKNTAKEYKLQKFLNEKNYDVLVKLVDACKEDFLENYSKE